MKTYNPMTTWDSKEKRYNHFSQIPVAEALVSTLWLLLVFFFSSPKLNIYNITSSPIHFHRHHINPFCKYFHRIYTDWRAKPFENWCNLRNSTLINNSKIEKPSWCTFLTSSNHPTIGFITRNIVRLKSFAALIKYDIVESSTYM